ncbi:hypothetical protein EXN66_Car003877 [Channa argus]|uniref:Uncharacterized protein n=1 Tax=Channa argus TaxID=215402 RepID=A0A6G1PD69_CHAAH|nr:hypothetical protein EXN66_Car003877 [Channa argus]
MKVILNEKKAASRSGDAVRDVQRRLSVKIKEGKEAYRRKLEQRLQQKDTRAV